MIDRSEIEAIDATLIALAREPRGWTPRSLAEAAAKTGGRSMTLVTGRLWSFGVDGGYSGPLTIAKSRAQSPPAASDDQRAT